MDLDEISKVAQDYLKAIWSETEWGDPPITSKALATRFGTTPANVSDTLKRLATQGLVRHEPYKAITLTPAGTRYAVAMVRRHRLLESYLVTALGYTWDEVHDEAENLEHAVSETLIDRIDSVLGHPATDPHGDPIPSAAGTVNRADRVIRLSDAVGGPHRVVRVSDADPGRLAWFEERGIVPGLTLEVDAAFDGSILVLGERHLELAKGTADAVWVTPADAV